MERQRILDVVYRVMEEVNEQRALGERLELSEDTILLGRASNLDSLGLVTLIAGIEQTLLDELGAEIIVADEKAMSQHKSPLRTVKSLVDYICSLGDLP